MPVAQLETVSDFEKLIKLISDNTEDVQLKDIDLSKIYPILGVKLTGNEQRLNGQLTSTICKGLSEFHLDLQKAYCIVRYNSDNLQKLRTEDKKNLEIIFKVEPGCTNIIGDLTALLDSLKDVVHKATDNMTGNQKTAFFLTLVLSIGGAYAFSSYTDLQKQKLTSEKEIKLAELNKGQIDTFTTALVDVVKDNNVALEKQAKVDAQTQKGYQGLIKTALLSGATNVDFNGATSAVLDIASASDMVANNQPSLETTEAKHPLDIISIKRTSDDNLSVTAKLESSEATFNLVVNTSFIEPSEIEILFNGLRNNQLVYVDGSYKVRQGVIEKAIASSVSSSAN